MPGQHWPDLNWWPQGPESYALSTAPPRHIPRLNSEVILYRTIHINKWLNLNAWADLNWGPQVPESYALSTAPPRHIPKLHSEVILHHQWRAVTFTMRPSMQSSWIKPLIKWLNNDARGIAMLMLPPNITLTTERALRIMFFFFLSQKQPQQNARSLP